MSEIVERLREIIAGAYVDGATAVHRFLFNDPEASPDFQEAANDYAAFAFMSDFPALIEQQAREIARLREDAARYRWLRDHSCPPHNFYISVPDEFHGVRYAPGDVDAYIDAARAALEKSNVE